MMLFFKKNKKVDDKNVIVKTDGGICSQIEFCCLGLYLQDLGYKVKYDISWFVENGLDCDGRFARNYDMALAFPELNFEIATEQEIKQAKRQNLFIDKIPHNDESGYICGYPAERGEKLIEYKDVFLENFKPVDIDSCKDILDNIKKSNSCGVHVRRGDLAILNSSYGYPTPKEYYIKAIKILNALDPKTTFFFFSEEHDWIKDNIIKNIDDKIKYIICDKNGADKGYLDLYLMSQCKHLISSSGSMGHMAKLLSVENGGIMFVDRYNKKIVENFDNVIILNDTILLNSAHKV